MSIEKSLQVIRAAIGPWWKRIFRSARSIENDIFDALVEADLRVVRSGPYAVIYDVVDPETAVECQEHFYEQFTSPTQARWMFRETFGDTTFNPRLVLILEPL